MKIIDPYPSIRIVDELTKLAFNQELNARMLHTKWCATIVSDTPLEEHRTMGFSLDIFSQRKSSNSHLTDYLENLWTEAILPQVCDFAHIEHQYVKLLNVLGNYSSLGDVCPVHTDGDSNEKEIFITALFYPHTHWSPEWGAETIFTNQNRDDIILSVMPKPGRLVLFVGDLPHAMRPITRLAPTSRMSLAFKIKIPTDQVKPPPVESNRTAEY